MWEDETIVLVTSLKKRILEGKDAVRFSKISADKGVPAFIKAKFKERVERYIVEETPLKLTSTPHFDLKPGDLKNLRTRFLDVLRQAAMFPGNEIESVLREALLLRMDYLVAPVDTLRRSLFTSEEPIEYAVVEKRLSPFLEHLSYAEYVLKQCDLRRPEGLTNHEYSRIISDLIQSVMDNDPVGTVINDFSVLLSFLSETKSEEITRVEADLVQAFLSDRNQVGFRRAIDVEVELGKKDFSSRDLELTIKRYLALRKEFSDTEKNSRTSAEAEYRKKDTAPDRPTTEAVDQKEPGQEKSEPVQDTSESEPAPEEWDFDDIGITEEASETDVPDDTIPSQETTAAEPEILGEDVQEEAGKNGQDQSLTGKQMRIIRREAKEPAEAEEQEAAEDMAHDSLRNYIDKKSEKNFIKKLFNGDQDAFHRLIEKLDEAESWRVAKILIDNELFKRDVDPFSREAIKLVDMVYGLYYPEEGIGGSK